MKQSTISVVLVTSVLLLASGLSLAMESKTEATQQEVNKVDASKKNIKGAVDVKQKKVAPIKLVDINNAKKEELMKLPGISAVEADKIIAGRPFGSKAWLVTNKIVPIETYDAIKKKIICKLSKKEIDKITATTSAKGNK